MVDSNSKLIDYYGLRMAYEVVWGGLIWKAPVEKALLRFHHRHPACEVNGGF